MSMDSLELDFQGEIFEEEEEEEIEVKVEQKEEKQVSPPVKIKKEPTIKKEKKEKKDSVLKSKPRVKEDPDEEVSEAPKKKKKTKELKSEKIEEVKETIDIESVENNFFLQDFLEQLKKKKFKKILYIIGAGVSVAAGIPDFRSPNSGFYAQLREAKVEEAEEIFNLDYFKENPIPFFTTAGEFLMKVSGVPQDPTAIVTSSISPTACHKFMLKTFENKQLSKILTQNIDSLELEAGLPTSLVVQIHGHMKTASCINCKSNYEIEEFWNCIRGKKIWYCEPCLVGSGVDYKLDEQAAEEDDKSSFRRSERTKKSAMDKQKQFLKNSQISSPKFTKEEDEEIPKKKKKMAIMNLNDCLIKPDILFFNEKMSKKVTGELNSALSRCDLIIIMGTSLQVKPISEIISTSPSHIPLVVLDRYLPKVFSSSLLGHPWLFLKGDIQETVTKIAHQCDWKLD